jgi:membrane-associated phospholipid phosphatase
MTIRACFRAAVAAALAALGAVPASAQNVAVPVARSAAAAADRSARHEPASAGPSDPAADTTATPTGPQERRILQDILSDQRAIWTSPFRVGGGDAAWLLPAAAITAGLIASDRHVNGEVAESDGAVGPSNALSHVGAGYTLLGAAGAFYLAGRASHDERARATGLLAFEALVDETIVVTALKQLTNRERPNKENGKQDFLDGGNAFPSGHAAASWAFAAVVAEQYRDRPLVRWTAFGLASAVSVARITSQKHSPSDVFVGGLIGYLVGRHVAKRGASGPGRVSFTFAPVVDAPTRSFGVAGAVSF